MKSFTAMIQIVTTIIVVLIYVSDNTVEALPMPGLYPLQELIYTYPSAASHQTTVVRDLLGNQDTAYAYQNHNGISTSSVAVSRSDNSKTLAYVPAIAPVIAAHHQPLLYAHQDHYHHHHSHISPAVAYSDYAGYV